MPSYVWSNTKLWLRNIKKFKHLNNKNTQNTKFTNLIYNLIFNFLIKGIILYFF